MIKIIVFFLINFEKLKDVCNDASGIRNERLKFLAMHIFTSSGKFLMSLHLLKSSHIEGLR